MEDARPPMDADGLPTNLSPLELHIPCWSDGAGIHIAIFDRPEFEAIPPGGNILDYLAGASYILTLNGWGALRMAEQLIHQANAGVMAGGSFVYDTGAPYPYPSDARHRIHARKRGIPYERMERGGTVDDSGNVAPFNQKDRTPKEGLMWDQVRDVLGKDPEPEAGSDGVELDPGS